MVMTPEDAEQEEGYSRLVDEILTKYRDNIIDEYLSNQIASYYLTHPDLAVHAEAALNEARNLIEVSASASLVFSRAATEITLRDVLLKPVAFGMVHDEIARPLIADLVVDNTQFMKLLFTILEDKGIDLKNTPCPKTNKMIWNEIDNIKRIRNNIIHRGEKATRDAAELSLFLADVLLHKLYPYFKRELGIE